MSSTHTPPLVQATSVAFVWVLAFVAAVVIIFVSPRVDAFGWLAVALAGSTVLAFALQLAVGRSDGYIARVAASVSGAFVVLLVTSVVVAVA